MANTYDPLKNILQSQGKAFTQENLNSLATSQGIANYANTDAQNVDLLNRINSNASPTASSMVKPIALDNLNVPKVNVPTSQVVPDTSIQPNMVESMLAKTQVAESEAQKVADSLSTKIASLAPQLQGQSQALADAQKAAGLQELNQNLTDINNQILMKTAEINKDDVQLAQSLQTIEDKPVAMEFITGEQASVQRNAQLSRALKNAEIGILNARAIGLQGNISLAQETAKQAVELKYAPQREAIATYKAQLEALQPILTKDEKKQAREQELRTKLALNELEVSQKNEQDLQAMIVNAASQGAPKSLIDSASKAKTSGQAAMILGQYAGDYYKTELLKNQIATEKAQRSKIYSDIANSAKELASKLSVPVATAANKIQSAQDTLNLVSDLLTGEGKGGAVGAGFKKTILSVIPGVGPEAIPGTSRAAYEAKFNQLKDTLAMSNLDKLKGAMSDKDIEFLRNTGTALNLSMAEVDFDKELKKIQRIMQNVPGVVDDAGEFENTLEGVNSGAATPSSYVSQFNFNTK